VLGKLEVARWLRTGWKLTRATAVQHIAVVHRLSDLEATGGREQAGQAGARLALQLPDQGDLPAAGSRAGGRGARAVVKRASGGARAGTGAGAVIVRCTMFRYAVLGARIVEIEMLTDPQRLRAL